MIDDVKRKVQFWQMVAIGTMILGLAIVLSIYRYKNIYPKHVNTNVLRIKLTIEDVLNAFQLRPIDPDDINLTPKLIRFNH